MQKQISKQGLTVLALSFLLVITIALTISYAAFTKKDTATGRVTFTDDGYAITITGNGVKTINENTWEFKLDALADGSFKTETIDQTITFTNIANGLNMFYNILISSTDAELLLEKTKNNIVQNTTALEVSVKLNEILKGYVLTDDIVDAGEFTVKVQINVSNLHDNVLFS